VTRLEEIRDLYAYERWANHRILDAVAAVPPEAYGRALASSFPSIRETLLHMLAASWVWLRRWKGSSPSARPEAWDDLAYEGLRDAWSDVEAEQERFVAELAEDGLDRVLEFRDVQGRAHTQPLWVLLRHVVNHSTYHRGQVVTLLRQVGGSPPSTDLAAYYYHRSG
jgi:uncharacterized damage-inducible protein DinB